MCKIRKKERKKERSIFHFFVLFVLLKMKMKMILGCLVFDRCLRYRQCGARSLQSGILAQWFEWHFALIVQYDVLIVRARLLERFRLVAAAHVAPQRVELDWHLKVSVRFASYAYVLQFGHDVAVYERHLVARQELGAAHVKEVVEAFEFHEQLTLFGLHGRLVDCFQVGIKFNVEVTANVFGLLVRRQVERREATVYVLLDS